MVFRVEITAKIYSFSISPLFKSRINYGITYNIPMSDKYKMRENEKTCFVTLTVVDWLDVFTRKNHKLKLVESFIYS